MKKIIFLLLCFNFSYAASAQIEFAPPGATWHYGYSDYAFGAGLLYSGYQKWSYERDTLFLDKNCKVLVGQAVKQIDGEVEIANLPERIIYQDSFKIYYWDKDRFYKMYDFGVAEGDTLTLAGGNHYTDSCSIAFQVDSVYYEAINGVSLKNIIIHPLNGTYASYWHINEKMGALPNFLFVAGIGCLLDVPRPFPFRCYQDNDFPLYQADTTSCEHYDNVSTITTLAELGMTINPNPVNDYFEIKNEEQLSYDLSIFNISGQSIFKYQEEQATQKTIDVSTWNPGTYIVMIRKGNQLAYKKILKLP